MSKGNMLQGQARGKVGDLVFYVRQGSQQTRVRNREPENPRTQSQMYQRVKLASTVGFYKRQASFFRFALKKTQKESYYNAFVRYNINIGPYLTREQVAANFVIPAPYIISDGNMPPLHVTQVTHDGVTDLVLVTDIPAIWETWGDMRRAMQLKYGDMLTLVVFNTSDEDTDPANRIISQHRFDAQSDEMLIGYDMVGTSWEKEGSVWNATVHSLYFGLTEFFATGSALVLSRNDGQVDCSFAQLKLDSTAEYNYKEFRSNAAREAAAASYGREKDALLDPKQFEGNYVDMITWYDDREFTKPVSEITMEAGSSDSLYYDNVKFSNAYYAEATLFKGSNVIDEVILNETPGAMLIQTAEGNLGTGYFGIQIFNEENVIIATSVLKVTATN